MGLEGPGWDFHGGDSLQGVLGFTAIPAGKGLIGCRKRNEEGAESYSDMA